MVLHVIFVAVTVILLKCAVYFIVVASGMYVCTHVYFVSLW